jgi:hypothetical protein
MYSHVIFHGRIIRPPILLQKRQFKPVFNAQLPRTQSSLRLLWAAQVSHTRDIATCVSKLGCRWPHPTPRSYVIVSDTARRSICGTRRISTEWTDTDVSQKNEITSRYCTQPSTYPQSYRKWVKLFSDKYNTVKSIDILLFQDPVSTVEITKLLMGW